MFRISYTRLSLFYKITYGCQTQAVMDHAHMTIRWANKVESSHIYFHIAM
jgi:hypothetical protein